MKRLILVPAIITLGVTLLRLVGELNGWSPLLFNPSPGGGAALVGIAWLVPVFGIYFALKLAAQGAHVSAGRAVLFPLLGVAAFFAIVTATRFAGVDPNAPTFTMLAVFVVASLAAAGITYWGMPALARVLFAYGLAARIPVAIVMLFAMMGNWGTHYDVAPPDFPAMGVLAKWMLIGVVPQLTFWMGYTLVAGVFCGGLALAVARKRPALQTA